MVAVPIGYQRPAFPSLFWPLGEPSKEFNNSFLYYFKDIWMFTVAWSMIFMTGIYTVAAGMLLISHYIGLYQHPTYRKDDERIDGPDNIELCDLNYSHLGIPINQHNFVNSLLADNTKMLVYTIIAYILVGAFQGFFAGSIVGVLIAAIYHSTQFKVTTWIPFVYSIIIALYNISSAYSFTVKSL